MRIVLFQPEIPQNTGNIVRTCSVTGVDLTLITPLGFQVSSKKLKRAGLDYWDEVNIDYSNDLEAYCEEQTAPFYFLSSHADCPYYDATFTDDTILIFGSETRGLPPTLHERYPDRYLTIPMVSGARCLNLATSVGIVLYEAIRQTNYLASRSTILQTQQTS
ncbi:MAG: tRNA (cytidine(34)-2'-O)-methyltransferase [Chlamydiia bacterium]|nr:tRNA (cytidine(34)-2'-O)-methyltransferase [Chlamydiia bacterium]